MKPKLLLDLIDFQVDTHRVIKEEIAGVCDGFEVLEGDLRGVREFDFAEVGILAGVVSAVCSIIALVLQARSQRHTSQQLKQEEVRGHIATVERSLQVQLPQSVKRELEEKLLTGQYLRQKWR